MISKEEVLELLKPVIDPDLGVSILDLGLIYDVHIKKKHITIDYTLTSPMCPHAQFLAQSILDAVKSQTDAFVDTQLLWDPPWTPERISDELRLSMGLPIDF